MTREVIIEFNVPAETLTLNKLPRTHGSAMKWTRIKNEWKEAAYWAAVAAFPGAGPSRRRMGPCDVYVSLPVHGQRHRDPGNWTATTKPIIDGFVEAGIWPDDHPGWVHEETVSFRPMSRSELGAARVVVRLVERNG